MYQKNKNKSNSNILENIKTILKLLIYFDTYSLVQKNSSDTKNHKKIYKGGSINSELDEIENEEGDQADSFPGRAAAVHEGKRGFRKKNRGFC